MEVEGNSAPQDASAMQEMPATEVPAEQVVSQPVQPRDDFSKRFELLTRKEREIQQRESRWKSEEQKWKEKETKLAEYEQDRQLAEYDPLGFMGKYGWTPERLTDHMIKTPGDPYQLKYQKKLEEMENRFKEFENKAVEEKRYKTYVDQLDTIKKYVESDRDKFELINEQGAHSQVFEVMAEYYNQYQERLSPEVAAEQVESYLEKQLERVVNYKKLKSKMGLSNPVPKEPGLDSQTLSQQRRPSTLTNSFAPVQTPQSNRRLSREEEIERVAKTFKIFKDE